MASSLWTLHRAHASAGWNGMFVVRQVPPRLSRVPLPAASAESPAVGLPEVVTERALLLQSWRIWISPSDPYRSSHLTLAGAQGLRTHIM